MWNEIRTVANCEHTLFVTHQVYPDSIMSTLAAACATVTNASYDSFMNFFGRCFVRYFSKQGYVNLFCKFFRESFVLIDCF